MSRLPSIHDAQSRLATSPTVDVYDAGVLLGVGEFSVRRAIDTGELPSIRLGRNIRVPSTAVRRLLGMETQ